MQVSERRRRFRQVLDGVECVSPAAVHDAVSARLAESFGFRIGMLPGSVASMVVLGAPDLVVMTLAELAEQVRRITRVSNLPLIVDADHGFGNALNAMRTVEEMDAAGACALTLEDTGLPIAFGHPRKTELVSLDEMVGKLRAGLAGRRDPALAVFARSAGLPIEGVDRTLERIRAYTATGVDAIFIVGMRTIDDVAAVHRVTHLPIVLGNRPTGMDDVKALEANGVRIALAGFLPYLSTIRAAYEVYEAIAKGTPASALQGRAPTDEMLGRATARSQYDAWIRDFLGG